MAAAALLVLFAVEGVTVPPVLLKIGSMITVCPLFPGLVRLSTQGSANARAPRVRSLVVVTTFTVLVSGIALMLYPLAPASPCSFCTSLVLSSDLPPWFFTSGAAFGDGPFSSARLAQPDARGHSRGTVAPMGVVASMVFGAPLGLLLKGWANSWFVNPLFH